MPVAWVYQDNAFSQSSRQLLLEWMYAGVPSSIVILMVLLGLLERVRISSVKKR